VLVAPHHRATTTVDVSHEVVRAGTSDTVGLVAPLPRLVARRRADTVLAAQWGAAVGAAALRRTQRLERLAIAAHGRELLLAPWPRPASLGYAALRRGVLRSADALFPVSHYTGGLLTDLGLDAARITVAPNGVDATRFAPVDPTALRRAHGLSGRVLLTVSRLVRRKGIDTTIAALAHLADDVRYVVVGEGPDRERLADLARPFGERVRLVGAVAEDDLAAWYSACDVFVMPARSEPPDVEGFGLVFLEAGAAERPVVGARAGGVVDAIDDGETGLLVPPGDVVALAGALRRILDDRAFAERLGAAGRARAEASSWDAVADRVAAALEGDRAPPV
jgi:phosphatidyl-myo-inositol dimannoside synthase